MVLLHGTLDLVIHEASDLPLSLSNQVGASGGSHSLFKAAETCSASVLIDPATN